MTMQNIKYVFYAEWVEDAGQFFADRHDFTNVTDARNGHNAALKFLWATDKQEPNVSDLFAITTDSDDKTGHARVHSRVTIQTGGDRP